MSQGALLVLAGMEELSAELPEAGMPAALTAVGMVLGAAVLEINK